MKRVHGGRWEQIDADYSCVPSEVHPWDPAIVARAREFDPNFVPVKTRRVYRTPANSIEIREFVMLARSMNIPLDDEPPLQISAVPKDFRFPPGSIYSSGRVLEYKYDRKHPKFERGMPGRYEPLDGRWLDIMSYMAWVIRRMGDKTLKDAAQDHADTTVGEDERVLAHRRREAALSIHDDRRMIRTAIGKNEIDAPAVPIKPYVFLPGKGKPS